MSKHATKTLDLDSTLTFGFEQTFTIPSWWTDEGFTATSDTPLKREKMLALAQEIANELGGSFKESVDIWKHMQYETFDKEGNASFVVTMDPGSIEVKTQPCLAKDAREMAEPLFKAAERAGLVAYRNWWYGIQGGTEGGCHVNMGGFSEENNPFIQRPDLAVKYAAYIHNRPWLHYPFMGLDVGPEGNAMRMDEKKGFNEVKTAFESYSPEMDIESTYKHFENTNLINEKASFPSLYKLKSPIFLIEDRGQEALRSSEEFAMVANLRLQIMQELLKTSEPEKLLHFSDLHEQGLCSYSLWENFQRWADSIKIDAQDFQRFFDRQFPRLSAGVNVPEGFWIKEGRRPRIITDIVKRGDTVVSKKIDTRYKRLELCFAPYKENLSFNVSGDGIEKISPVYRNNGKLGFGENETAGYCYVDVKTNLEKPVLKIQLGENTASFHLNDMMWV